MTSKSKQTFRRYITANLVHIQAWVRQPMIAAFYNTDPRIRVLYLFFGGSVCLVWQFGKRLKKVARRGALNLRFPNWSNSALQPSWGSRERKKEFLRHLEIYGPGILAAAAATGGILGKKVEIISRQKNKWMKQKCLISLLGIETTQQTHFIFGLGKNKTGLRR